MDDLNGARHEREHWLLLAKQHCVLERRLSRLRWRISNFQLVLFVWLPLKLQHLPAFVRDVRLHLQNNFFHLSSALKPVKRQRLRAPVLLVVFLPEFLWRLQVRIIQRKQHPIEFMHLVQASKDVLPKLFQLVRSLFLRAVNLSPQQEAHCMK